MCDAIRRDKWDAPLEVICRIHAEPIQSVNDAWGVLSKSRIALLPHQLWVCRRVLQSWPVRWLVADDGVRQRHGGWARVIEAHVVFVSVYWMAWSDDSHPRKTNLASSMDLRLEWVTG